MAPRCRPGDLAVVVASELQVNLGRIVKVERPAPARWQAGGDWVPVPLDWGPCWWVSSPVRMIWRINGRTVRRRSGVVPDRVLQPIRGERPVVAQGKDQAVPVALPLDVA